MFPDGSANSRNDIDNFITVTPSSAQVDVDSDLATQDGVFGVALTPSYRAMYFAIKLKTTNTDVATVS
jgi:hypothetical protein